MALTEIELPLPSPSPPLPMGCWPSNLPSTYTSRRLYFQTANAASVYKEGKLFSGYFEKLLYFHSMIDYTDIHRDGAKPG